MVLRVIPSRFDGRFIAALAVAGALLGTGLVAKETFTAQAVNLSNVGRSGAVGTVDIIISRYSTQAERNRFLTALKDGGNEGLLRAFEKAPSIGKIGPTGQVGLDIRYAHETPGDEGGRQIVIATDRRMSFLEAANRPRTVDYPFTVVQLNLDRSGNGEGKASFLTRIEIDKKRAAIVLEDFASQPVDLKAVRRTSDTP